MTKSFRKIGFAVLFTALTFVSAQAQTVQEDKPTTHQCTEQCSNGKHVYAHGEEGHTCDASCKEASTTMELNDHVCTDACKDGKHMYAHGEKGHTCDASCKEASTTMELKDHVCTDACKDGKHMYAHGEKGHVCDESCKSNMK